MWPFINPKLETVTFSKVTEQKHPPYLIHINRNKLVSSFQTAREQNAKKDTEKYAVPWLTHDDNIDATNAAEGDSHCQDDWHWGV